MKKNKLLMFFLIICCSNIVNAQQETDIDKFHKSLLSNKELILLSSCQDDSRGIIYFEILKNDNYFVNVLDSTDNNSYKLNYYFILYELLRQFDCSNIYPVGKFIYKFEFDRIKNEYRLQIIKKES